MSDEYQLIEAARTDDASFHVLYNRYFARVYAYIAYRVGRNEDAEDLTSETFMKVVEHFHTFTYRGEGSFAAWIFRIAYNSVGNFYRRNPRHRTFIPLDDLPLLASPESPLEAMLVRQEGFSHLQNLIKQLPPRRQEVITLRFFGGLRNQEIAIVLNLDERTVASHLSRALEDLYRNYSMEETS